MRLGYSGKRIMAGILVVLGLLVVAFAYFSHVDKFSGSPPLALESIPALGSQTRLLVFAPHCDDETLGCAGIMHDVIKAGGQVVVVIMTNGDGFTVATEEQFKRLFLTSADYIRSGHTRQMELLRALALLGLRQRGK